MNILDIIVKKRDGLALADEEIAYAVEGYVHGEILDYQMAALLMAAFIRGLDRDETLSLTGAMIDSGERIDLSSIPGVMVDKHSTGGVGDKVTLVVLPLVVAAGGRVAKMSGRALGYTGGTIDKLDSIPGFRTQLGKEEFVEQVARFGAAITGQTGEVCPADKLIYSLRDVTGTVSSPPLIAASIVSKKVAGGADAIVYDVKVGSGAFLKNIDEARSLAETLVELTTGLGRKATAVISDMSQPLGLAVGNSLEVEEAIDTLKDRGPADLVELCYAVASRMLVMGGTARDLGEASEMMDAALASGRAIETFAALIREQGGDDRVVENPRELLPHAKYVDDFTAPEDGYIDGIDAELVGRAVVELGAGRTEKDAPIDPSVGLLFVRKAGDYAEAGQPIAQLHANDPHKLVAASEILERAITFSAEPVEPSSIIIETFENK